MFVAARDEIEYAQEDAETVYFNESCEEAREAVAEVLDAYTSLLGRLSAEERGKLQRSMGLKMEQLKAEVETLDTLHDD
ncbi:late embryogenesis abundant [Chlorella sorokiniana]|uniref:Late embryogenesis abundant n=1 Tax=Chlorella sorokiniana TaxID=3076 RepID=A0A2P6TL91_CHLSO|nr:late embryogenesis abundant [Chlorella sorokiniana]|eukprot:PRW45044.1 late embryogenesis abundant [Chlorella sorokiniana]